MSNDRIRNGDVMFLEPSMGSTLEAVLHRVSAFEAELQTRPEAVKAMADDFWPDEGTYLSFFRPYVVREGTLHVPVRGVLLHDFPYAYGSWATGYEYLRKAIERGRQDPEVQRIALRVNSGGGMVSGLPDTAQAVLDARADKPVQAFVDDFCASAAFWVASAANRVSLTQTGMIGSVGTVITHVQMEKALEKMGLKVTLIYAGAHKVDGNAYEELPADVRKRYQARADSLRQTFAEGVARNLGMTVEAVLETEAQVYSAEEAVAIGFAHGISTTEAALGAFQTDPNNAGETNMSQKNETPTAEITQADVDAARAEGKAAGEAEGRKLGVAAERSRIQTILASDAAKDRETFALHVALNTDLSAEAAASVIEASPKQTAQGTAQRSPFETAMDNSENPDLGAGNGDGGSSKSDSASLLADYAAATGQKLEKK